MPTFDTPISTDDASLPKVLQQTLPVLLYLYNQPNADLDVALTNAAKKHAGRLLVARVDTRQSPQALVTYKNPALPAVFALKNGHTQSHKASVQPADIKAHAAFLVGEGAKPQDAPTPPPDKTAAHPTAVSDKSFMRDVLQSKTPVLVDFWAPWCGPCRMVAPILDTLAQKYVGQIKVVKLNVDDNPQTASKYQTMSIPTLILFKDGKLIKKLVGAHPQPVIERLIQTVITL